MCSFNSIAYFCSQLILCLYVRQLLYTTQISAERLSKKDLMFISHPSVLLQSLQIKLGLIAKETD